MIKLDEYKTIQEIKDALRYLPKEDKIAALKQELTNRELSNMTKPLTNVLVSNSDLEKLIAESVSNHEAYESATERKELIPFIYDRDLDWFFNVKNVGNIDGYMLPVYEFLESQKDCAIYTLAQSGTAKGIALQGNGSDLSNDKGLKGKGKRKIITQKMVGSLIDAERNMGENILTKSYWNTYHCQNKIHTSNGRLYGKYCKNRFCTSCNAIRKADIINRYLPTIAQWEQPYFVTLTVKAFGEKRLEYMIDHVLRAFQRIKDRNRKRHERGKGILLVGIKSLECNFNPIAKTYNPHLHLIVQNKAMADILIAEWIELWERATKYKYVSIKAQLAVPVKDRETTLIEIVKYGSKIFTEPDINKKGNGADNREIYAAALNNIFHAMKGKRIFDRFGFDLPKKDVDAKGMFVCNDAEEWQFDIKELDWVNYDTGEKLTNYIPPKRLMEILENRVDTKKR